MATLDAFNTDAFSLTTLSGVIEKMDYIPQFLGELGVFEIKPVRTRTVWVDRSEGENVLIQTSADGSAPAEAVKNGRSAVALKAVRLAKGATINAAEIASWRAFGSESEQELVMREYARRMEKVRNDMELTHEYHRLAAIQGKLLDADGSVIYDYVDKFGEATQSNVSFAFSDANADMRTTCVQVARAMAKASEGAFTPSTQVHALAGDDFFDNLIKHASVRDTFLNHAAAADLRGNTAFTSFVLGGITFHNYRGTDDSKVAVNSTEAHFFPVGARDVFVKAQAPADEFMPYVGQSGQNIYSMNLRDPSGRDAWVRNEQYSYPLYMCQRPSVLRKGTLT